MGANSETSRPITMRLKFLLSAALVLGASLINSAHGAIIYPEPPDGGQQLAQKYLDPTFLKGFKITSTNDVTLGPPFRGYGFSLSEMASGLLVPTNPFDWWDYPVMVGTNCNICISLVADRSNTNRLKFANMGGSFPPIQFRRRFKSQASCLKSTNRTTKSDG